MSLHVMPVNDVRPHEVSRWCWCIPTVQTRFPNPLEIMTQAIVTHNALDGRNEATLARTGTGDAWEVRSI